MSHHEQGLIDILEIYHARQLRDQLLANLRRLRDRSGQDVYGDSVRRQETWRYYEAMLLTVAELLQGLGDEEPLA